MSSPFGFSGDPSSRVVATAIHAGHDVRPEVAALLALDDATRLREEDPFTDRMTSCADFRVTVWRSRFEVDLNRSRKEAVYRDPGDAWSLTVWRTDPPPDVVQRSLEIHDSFYEELGSHLDQLSDSGPFVVLDIHSYNHRRGGPGSKAAAQVGNPDVNVGTGSMPATWRPVANAFIAALAQQRPGGRPLDVRENVRFKGRHLARWVHERYPKTGCALALEFKKTFMDEWTGEVDVDHLDSLTSALRNAVPSVLDSLERAA
ncbi:MAG TPA: N-formylglutamate amidohydrolase [Aeromicrobium sp.]|nr:N-formylglutamate amidohydrolase [Aeromicrobium sp.]